MYCERGDGEGVGKGEGVNGQLERGRVNGKRREQRGAEKGKWGGGGGEKEIYLFIYFATHSLHMKIRKKKDKMKNRTSYTLASSFKKAINLITLQQF